MTIDLPALVTSAQRFAAEHQLGDRVARQRFSALLPDVLEQATVVAADETIFIKTGDIPAMWLRDAAFQVLPYVDLIPFDSAFAPFLAGVLQRMWADILHDPYANAFNLTASDAHWRADDQSDIPISPRVWERKFEIDSLCAPLLLAERLVGATGDTSLFDATFWRTVDVILTTFETEQHHATSPYFFVRTDVPEDDTLPNDGRGTPVADTGMVWSGFRPSDNACVYGYHIPGNMFIVSVLRDLLPFVSDAQRATRMTALIDAITAGIDRFALIQTPDGETGYAYEVDGLGHQLVMDDANVPSLLAAPFFGYCPSDDPRYLATRKLVLSDANPYYYQGQYAAGIGSNHTPAGYVWPIAMAMVGLTNTDQTVRVKQLHTLATLSENTGQIPESFDPNDPTRFTRDWFSWANATYCQLALSVLAGPVG